MLFGIVRVGGWAHCGLRTVFFTSVRCPSDVFFLSSLSLWLVYVLHVRPALLLPWYVRNAVFTTIILLLLVVFLLVSLRPWIDVANKRPYTPSVKLRSTSQHGPQSSCTAAGMHNFIISNLGQLSWVSLFQMQVLILLLLLVVDVLCQNAVHILCRLPVNFTFHVHMRMHVSARAFTILLAVLGHHNTYSIFVSHQQRVLHNIR